ncbi:MAG: response regulator [Bacteriovoracaceae bacterium]|nr:response regulator [Bacteriovoracaceae bacterium]
MKRISLIMLNGKTVLIVDDEKELCEIIASELLVSGANPVQAHSVKDALERLSQAKFDLVISDIRMPGDSGVDLLDTLRLRGDNLPVILMTGFADISEHEAIKRGAGAVVSKPFDLDDLFKVCNQLI